MVVVFWITSVRKKKCRKSPDDDYFPLGSTYQNAQKMYEMYKQFDKNGDGKITAEDIEIYLQEIGLGSVSPCS